MHAASRYRWFVFFLSLFVLYNISPSSSFLTWIAVRLPLEGTVATPGAPWPIPQEWHPQTIQKTLNPGNFEFLSNLENCDVITNAFERYGKLITLSDKGTADPDLSLLRGLRVSVTNTNCSDYPRSGDNETYYLTIDGDVEARLEAVTVWGALRGLETFSQLLYLTDDYKYQVNQTGITDFPRYSYRGLMIDTARHFYPVNTIIKILDAMSWDKLNVLHWHIVDDQSFPYQCITYPNLTELGAYSSHHIYSQENVRTILNEARLRGIRVIPEFDTPGHTWSWGRAFLSLITPCYGNGPGGGANVPNYPIHGPQEIFNPMLNETYNFLQSIYEEIVSVFPDEYVHLGMDEIYTACWKTNPVLSEWMETMGFNEMNEVEEYYAQRLIDIVEHLERSTKYIIWQDPIDNNVTVQADTIVEIWKSDTSWQDYASHIADRGRYKMILSAPWYLNYISYGQDWKNYYNIEPDNFTEDTSLHSLWQGGEACAWSEYIDSTNVLSLLWPRVSAVAERLWSSKEETDVESAKFRLDQQRCRMVRRGIEAKPILNGYCGDYEWDVKEFNPNPPETTTSAITTPDITIADSNGQASHKLMTILIFQPVIFFIGSRF